MNNLPFVVVVLTIFYNFDKSVLVQSAYLEKEYHTSSGTCHNCGFHGYKYQWCTVGGNKGTWDYCSTKPGYTTRNNKCRSDHECGHHGHSYLWCYRKSGGWDYCSKVQEEQEERTVTSYNEVFRGVDIDYRYNESINWQSGNFSVPGCPKTWNGKTWILHGKPPRCYLAGGGHPMDPCKEDQKFARVPGSMFGICNCACFNTEIMQETFDYGLTQMCQSEPRKPMFVYLAESKQCFQLFEQGPCKKDQWLVLVHGNIYSVQCERRRCPENSIPKEEVDRYPWIEDSPISYHRRFRNDYTGPYEKNCMMMRVTGLQMAEHTKSIECNEKTERYSKLLRKCLKKIKRVHLIG